jgi:hypothetical protein
MCVASNEAAVQRFATHARRVRRAGRGRTWMPVKHGSKRERARAPSNSREDSDPAAQNASDAGAILENGWQVKRGCRFAKRRESMVADVIWRY